MTRRLILMRHAKSSWKDASQPDHERPLNKRGRASCDAIGAWLARRGDLPDQVLCSSAVRTRETWQRVAAQLPDAPAPDIAPSLYLAEPGTLLAVLNGAAGACVAMLAHNPGIAAFARLMVEPPPAHPDFARYPTLATMVADFDVTDWSEAVPGSGRVVDFTVPRALTG